MDFLVGEVTRSHKDIDFVIWADDLEKVRRILLERGYSLHPDFDETEYNRMFQKQGQQIEIIFITRNSEGQVITPGPFAHWPWPKGSFKVDAFHHLESVTCPIASPESILDTKEGMQHHMPERETRSHDKSDISRLRALVRSTMD